MCGSALVPTKMVDHGNGFEGIQAIDTIVHPDMRGKFIFMRMGKLAEEYAASRKAMLWGFPNAQAARGWFGRLQWQRTGSVPFLIRPLRSGYVLRRFSALLGKIDLRLVRRSRAPAGYRNQFDPLGYDAVWASIRDSMGVGVDRSGEWMQWRLARPCADYRYGTVGGEMPVAAAATRTAAKHGGTITYVMEAIARPGNEKALAGLLKCMIAEECDKGAEVALAWCPSTSVNYRAYRAAGFLPFPDRYRPIEIHHGFWVDPLDMALQAHQGSDWYLSYMDSDTV